MYLQVIVDLPIQTGEQTYDYSYNGDQNLLGYRVSVRVGPQKRHGIVIGISETTQWDPKKVRQIDSVLDEHPVLNQQQIALAFWLAKTTGVYFYMALQTMLPAAKRLGKKQGANIAKQSMVVSVQDIVLSKTAHKQKEALAYTQSVQLPKSVTELKQMFGASAIQALVQKGALQVEEQVRWRNPYEHYEVLPCIKHELNNQQKQAVTTILQKQQTVTLLHGVTGSGKTEVFMSLIESMLLQGKSTIVLVPEIALTPQIVQRFKSRFQTDVAVLHSHLSDGERYDQWRLIEQQQIPIVIGTRSAVFAPVTNLGMIILDEEHDASYKQQNQPMYHARDVAIYRAQQVDAQVILASATPSLETYARAMKHRYSIVELTQKAVEKQLTQIEVIDLREEFRSGNLTMISRALETAILDALAKQEQVLLLFNRRGYAQFVKCRECGYTVMCPNCDISLTYHKHQQQLQCHYCDFQLPKPVTCPQCQSEYIREFGSGIQKLEEYVQKCFPQARTIRMDRDTTSRKGGHEAIIDQFSRREADILIGTQMVAKGLDFEHLTVVGVVSADQALNFPDFRASERTFQLLMQVAGRAGRHKPGKTFIQTYNPDHYAIVCAKQHQYRQFYESEMRLRKMGYYPPYCFLTVLHIYADTAIQAQYVLEQIKRFFHGKTHAQTRILGPTKALIPKVDQKDHYYLVFKYRQEPLLHSHILELQKHWQKQANVKLKLEIDPEFIG